MNNSALRWRCRRGMRELDEAMLAYLNNHFDGAPAAERDAFEELLSTQDPELYRLVTGKDTDERYQSIIDKIQTSLTAKQSS